jgi:hypothetical protein
VRIKEGRKEGRKEGDFALLVSLFSDKQRQMIGKRGEGGN